MENWLLSEYIYKANVLELVLEIRNRNRVLKLKILI